MYTGIFASITIGIFIGSIVLVGFGQLWAAPMFWKSFLMLVIGCPLIADLEEWADIG